ncbi:uncharacterized protein [Macrobrachium rosenbergii]|uniref:uncharacterized protein isoform X2 n=1 Tax=Macrobrachium rosenbergii TaxID=79674 RepID=UPI0034D47FA1
MSDIEDFSSQIDSLEEDDLVYLDCYLDTVYNVSPDLTSIWSPLSQDLNECSPETCSLQPIQSNNNNNNEVRDDNSLQNVRPLRKNRGIPRERFVSYNSFPSVQAKQYPCKFCGLNLSTKESSKRHILSKHVKERHHLCNVCGKTFVFKFSLNAHSAIHEDTPRHVCVCGVSFKLRTSYMSHVRRIHQAASEIKFSCELCFKSFRDRHTLRLHMTSVHKPKTIPCKAKGCKKVFSSVSLMRCHYRYHLNQKFTCDKCGQSFSTESYMQKHILSHSGEKPFKCEVCGYATAYRNTYYAHRKKHLIAQRSSDTPDNESVTAFGNHIRGLKRNDTSETKDKSKKNIFIKPKLPSIKNNEISSSSSKHEHLPNVHGSKVHVISPQSPSSSSPSYSSRTMFVAKQVNMNFNFFSHNVINDSGKRENGHDLCDTTQLAMKCTDSDAKFIVVKDSVGVDGQNVKGSNNLCLKECTNRQISSTTEKNDCSIILSNNGRCSISECKSVDDSLFLIKIGDNSFAGVCSDHSVSSVGEIPELNLSFVEDLTLTAVDSKCLGSDLAAESVLSVCSPTASITPVHNFIASFNEQKLFMVSPSKSDVNLLDMNRIDQPRTLMTECDQTDMTGDILLPLGQLENIKSSSEVNCNVNVESSAEIDVGMPSLSSHIDDSFHLAHMEVVCRLCDEQFFCMDTYITHLESIHK